MRKIPLSSKALVRVALDAAQEAVHKAVQATGSYQEIIEITGYAESTVYNQINRFADTHPLTLPTFLASLEATHDLAALDEIEQVFGRVAIELAEVTDAERDLPLHLANALKEFGELVERYGKLLSRNHTGDQKITPGEARAFSRSAFDAIAAIEQFRRGILGSAGVA